MTQVPESSPSEGYHQDFHRETDDTVHDELGHGVDSTEAARLAEEQDPGSGQPLGRKEPLEVTSSMTSVRMRRFSN